VEVTVAEKSEIEVTIRPDGEVRIVTRGLTGQSCLAETKELEKALGTVTRREKTSEYYQREKASGKVKQR
jgi:hypothetical protein